MCVCVVTSLQERGARRYDEVSLLRSAERSNCIILSNRSAFPSGNDFYTKSLIRQLWHGDLPTKDYANEPQAKVDSSPRRGTGGRGCKSTFRDRHRFIDVSDDWHATGYRVCAGYVESLHIPAAIASSSRSATVASLYQSHAISSHNIAVGS